LNGTTEQDRKNLNNKFVIVTERLNDDYYDDKFVGIVALSYWDQFCFDNNIRGKIDKYATKIVDFTCGLIWIGKQSAILKSVCCVMYQSDCPNFSACSVLGRDKDGHLLYAKIIPSHLEFPKPTSAIPKEDDHASYQREQWRQYLGYSQNEQQAYYSYPEQRKSKFPEALPLETKLELMAKYLDDLEAALPPDFKEKEKLLKNENLFDIQLNGPTSSFSPEDALQILEAENNPTSDHNKLFANVINVLDQLLLSFEITREQVQRLFYLT
jgi:hypothetical protein